MGQHPIEPTQGGTGISNNNSNTLTLSGGYPITLVANGVSAVTLPASGTLITSSSSIASTQLPAFGGDVLSTSGTSILTLAAVNTNVGSFINANITVNAKGLITAASSGTSGLTSVGLSDGSTIPIYTVTHSPLTTNGTLTFTLNSQTANYFFASPNGSAGQPTFRAIVISDIPTLNQNTTGTATTANNIIGGTAGSIPYQSASNTTTFLPRGTNGYILTLTSGIPTWAAAPSNGVSSITGTVRQITTSSGTGAVTLSLPQNIDTTSTPMFSAVTVGSGATIGAAPISYGSLNIDGSTGGYCGLQFSSSNDDTTLMVQAGGSATPIVGFYNQSGTPGWLWYFTGGTLTQGTIPGGNVSGAVAIANLADGIVTASSSINANYNVAFLNGASVFYNSSVHINPSTGTLYATAVNQTSDRTKKTNIRPIDNSLEIIKNLNGVRFDWIADGRSSAGLIAQDVEQVMPELVETSEYKTLNYNGIIGALVEAVKELSLELAVIKEQLKIKSNTVE
jgi:hypothetical protein